MGSLAVIQPLCSEIDFKQGLRYGDEVYDNLRTVGLVQTYREPDGTWSDAWFDYTTSFDVLRANGFQKNVFNVAGIARNGDTVIERWQAIPPIPIGGGPPDPSAVPSMQRTELYRGTSIGSVVELGPDPEGRYTLVLHATPALPGNPYHPGTVKSLSMIDLSTGTVSSVLDVLEAPALQSAIGMYVMEHVSEGRLWILESEGVYPKTVLYDSNNDEDFESWTTLSDEDAWAGMGYDGAVWLNDFTLEWYW